MVIDAQEFGQRRLVAQEDAELEERGVASADLREPNELLWAGRGVDDDFVRREGAVTRVEQRARDGLVGRAQGSYVLAGFGDFRAAGYDTH